MSNGKHSDLGFFMFIGIIIVLLIPLLFGVNSISDYLQTQKRILLGITIAGLVLLLVITVIVLKKKYNIKLKNRRKTPKKELEEKEKDKTTPKKKPERIVITNEEERLDEELDEVKITFSEREQQELERLNKTFKG